MKWLSLLRTHISNFPMKRTQIFGRDPSNKNQVDLSLADMDMSVFVSDPMREGFEDEDVFNRCFFIYSEK